MTWIRLVAFIIGFLASPQFCHHVQERLHLQQYEGCVIDEESLIPGEKDEGFPSGAIIHRNTIEKCIAHCKEATSYTFAGMRNGSECLCGNTYFRTSSMDCYSFAAKRCPGNSNAMCGGQNGATSVYRVCPVGEWGAECEKSCPDCGDYGCNMENGECLTVCRAGRSGQNCSEPCTGVYFGPDCKEFSWSCLNKKVDPIMGYCLEGCRFYITYFGPFCQKESADSYLYPPEGCPMCPYCKDAMCENGSGDESQTITVVPSYFQCGKIWKGDKCTECIRGKWGIHCEKSCVQSNCTECNLWTGDCTSNLGKRDEPHQVLADLGDTSFYDEMNVIIDNEESDKVRTAMIVIKAILGIELLAGIIAACIMMKRNGIVKYLFKNEVQQNVMKPDEINDTQSNTNPVVQNLDSATTTASTTCTTVETKL